MILLVLDRLTEYIPLTTTAIAITWITIAIRMIIMYILMNIITVITAVTLEQRFIHGVWGDALLLSLLSLSTIVPIFVNTDVVTLKFDKDCNTLLKMNHFARNNDIIHYTKCDQLMYCCFGNFLCFYFFSHIYVIMSVAAED